MIAVSIVIPTRTRFDLLEECLASLREARSLVSEPTELIVVSDGGPDSPRELVRAADPAAAVIELPESVGFSGAVSEGIDAAAGEWVMLLNDDTTAGPKGLVELLAAARSGPRVGSATPQLRFSSDPETINSAGLVIDRLGISSDRLLGSPVSRSERGQLEVFGTSAAAALYRRAMLEEIGGFDRSFFAHLEDADVAWRARMRGWKCVYAPSAVFYHRHSATLQHFSKRKYYLGGRNRVRLLAKNADARMLRRHGLSIIAYDTAYVVYVAIRERTIAPLRGRLAGIRDWRRYRRAGEPGRRAVPLARSVGFRGALGRRGVWSRSTAARTEGASTRDSRG